MPTWNTQLSLKPNIPQAKFLLLDFPLQIVMSPNSVEREMLDADNWSYKCQLYCWSNLDGRTWLTCNVPVRFLWYICSQSELESPDPSPTCISLKHIPEQQREHPFSSQADIDSRLGAANYTHWASPDVNNQESQASSINSRGGARIGRRVAHVEGSPLALKWDSMQQHALLQPGRTHPCKGPECSHSTPAKH